MAAARLELLRLGIVEMAEQDLVRQRQRPREPAAHDREVALHGLRRCGRHRRCGRGHSIFVMPRGRVGSLGAIDPIIWIRQYPYLEIWQMELRHLRYFVAVAEEATSRARPSGSACNSRR